MVNTIPPFCPLDSARARGAWRVGGVLGGGDRGLEGRSKLQMLSDALFNDLRPWEYL